MIVIIDRFEGEFAVVELENMQFINMPKQLLPQSAREGSVISIEINEQETDKRKQRITKLMKKAAGKSG